MPISKPGLMMRVPGWLLDPSGPLSIRPYYFPKLLPWLLRFLAQGRMDRVKALAEAAASLSRDVIHDFDTLLKAADAQHLVQGECCATIYDDEAEYAKSEWEWQLRAEHGFPCRKISGAEMHELEPDVSERIGCAVIMGGWRNLTDPYRFVAMMAERFERDGGELVLGDVKSVDVSDSRAHALQLGGGTTVDADEIVIAAGAWSHKLAAGLGSKVPLEADRGYNKTMPNTGISLGRQLVYETAGLAVTPLEQGLRIGGAVELADVDAPPDYRRSERLVEKAKKILPGLTDTSGEIMDGAEARIARFHTRNQCQPAHFECSFRVWPRSSGAHLGTYDGPHDRRDDLWKTSENKFAPIQNRPVLARKSAKNRWCTGLFPPRTVVTVAVHRVPGDETHHANTRELIEACRGEQPRT